MHLISSKTGIKAVVDLAGWASILLITGLLITGCQSKEDTSDKASNPQLSPVPQASSGALSAPPPPPQGAYLGKVSPAVSSQLKGLPVLAPAYIPEKFTLAEHSANPPGTYALIYRSADQCFAIEYIAPDQVPSEPETIPNGEAASLGSPTFSPSEQLHFGGASFDSPIFGPDRQLYYSNTASDSDLVSEWLINQQGRYRLIGASRITQNYPNQTQCRDVSLTEAVAIVTSLIDLTAEPTAPTGDY
jgi:hypothetical protein